MDAASGGSPGDGDEPAPAPRRVKRRAAGLPVWGWILLAALVLFGGTFAVVNYLVMPRAVGFGQHVSVPNVVGLPYEGAAQALEGAGLRAVRSGDVPSADVPAGAVAATDPPGGMETKPGRVVSISVSTGPDVVRVPNVENQPLRSARVLLESAGLAPGRVSYAYSDWVARGLVIATTPPVDSGVVPGGVVEVRVSLGPPPTGFVMPDLRGFRVDGVEQMLRDQGYRVQVEGRVPAGEDGELLVIDQYPSPGAHLAPGDSVLLVGGR